jgi:hypothetical protein
LHPDHLRARLHRQRFVDNARGIFRPAEDVDHVHRIGNVRELGVDFFAEDFLAYLARIDRDHAVSALLQIFEGEIAGPVIFRRNADHGDGLHGIEDAANIIVGIAVVVHGRAFRKRRT